MESCAPLGVASRSKLRHSPRGPALVVPEEGEEDLVVPARVRARGRVEVAAAKDEDAEVPGAGLVEGEEGGDVAALQKGLWYYMSTI